MKENSMDVMITKGKLSYAKEDKTLYMRECKCDILYLQEYRMMNTVFDNHPLNLTYFILNKIEEIGADCVTINFVYSNKAEDVLDPVKLNECVNGLRSDRTSQYDARFGVKHTLVLDIRNNFKSDDVRENLRNKINTIFPNGYDYVFAYIEIGMQYTKNKKEENNNVNN